jgi:hypothetical protein
MLKFTAFSPHPAIPTFSIAFRPFGNWDEKHEHTPY